jgi:hypothetical protein
MKRAAPALVALALALAALGGWLAFGGGGSSSEDYAPFARCPLGERATDLCLYSRASGGELTVGSRSVPLSRPVVFQGGVHVLENGRREVVRERFLAPARGPALSLASEPVPGGLRSALERSLLPGALRARLARYLAGGPAANALAVTIELAAPASTIEIDIQNLIERSGIALTLPVKVRLSNPFLQSSCRAGAHPLYIGSDAHPIALALTTGTTDPPAPNRPIHGRVAHTSVKDEYNVTAIGASSLVNNSFAAPAVHGCAGAQGLALQRALDAGLGLPAPAGVNTAILQGSLSDANAAAVRSARTRG